MCARQKHLRPTRLFAHVHDISPDAVAGIEVFARNDLLAPEQRLGAAEIDDHIAELDAFHQTVHDVADPVLELVVLPAALRLTHLMNNDLFGGLRRYAAEINRR